jgi:hypothetical protein
MVALKNLVICITNYFKVIINKTFVNRNCNGSNLYLCFQVVENNVQPFQLPWIFGKYENIVLFFFIILQVPDQQVELPVESGLFLCRE